MNWKDYARNHRPIGWSDKELLAFINTKLPSVTAKMLDNALYALAA